MVENLLKHFVFLSFFFTFPLVFSYLSIKQHAFSPRAKPPRWVIYGGRERRISESGAGFFWDEKSVRGFFFSENTSSWYQLFWIFSSFPSSFWKFSVVMAEEYRTLLSSQGFELIRVSPLASFDLVAMEAIWSPENI